MKELKTGDIIDKCGTDGAVLMSYNVVRLTKKTAFAIDTNSVMRQPIRFKRYYSNPDRLIRVAFGVTNLTHRLRQ